MHFFGLQVLWSLWAVVPAHSVARAGLLPVWVSDAVVEDPHGLVPKVVVLVGHDKGCVWWFLSFARYEVLFLMQILVGV